MRDRKISLEKLVASLEKLLKASDVHIDQLEKDIHMSPSTFYKTLHAKKKDLGFYAIIIHHLVINGWGCGMDKEIEEVKREWWNVVTVSSWELIPKKVKGKKKEEDTPEKK